MARRVYLHIGLMKTATSYIGQLCELNRDRLAAARVLWPAGDLRYQAIRDLFGRAAETDAPGAWRALNRQLREQQGDVIICNELLAAVDDRRVRRLVGVLDPAEVHVVVTLRDLARVIPSHWQTTIKNGRTHEWSDFAAAVCMDSPDEYVAAEAETWAKDPPAGEDSPALRLNRWFWQRHDAPAIVSRWQRFVPPERVTVVTVPLAGGDREAVARRFGSVVGVDLLGLEQPESWSNSSLGAHSAELMRRLNEDATDLDAAERSYGFKHALGRSLVAGGQESEPRFALNPPQQDWVSRRAHAMVRQLERSGVRVVGDLADLIPAPHPPSDALDPAASSDPELLQAASRGLIGMVRSFAELRSELAAEAAAVSQLRAKSDRLQQRVEAQRRRIDELARRLDPSPHARVPAWTRLRSRLASACLVRRVVTRLRG
jgi:hypothetical protein